MSKGCKRLLCLINESLAGWLPRTFFFNPAGDTIQILKTPGTPQSHTSLLVLAKLFFGEAENN